jgi:hypothetical protein
VRFSSARFSPRRLMIVRDPDGYFIELINPDQSPNAPEPGNVLGATFRYAVDANRAARFFGTAFGFKVIEAGDFTDDPVLGKMTAIGTVLPRSHPTRATSRLTTVPCNVLRVESLRARQFLKQFAPLARFAPNHFPACPPITSHSSSASD